MNSPPSTTTTPVPDVATEPVLELSGIYKSFPGVDALKDVSFNAVPGEVHALLGENGAGKSTLMAIASGEIEADRGRISLGGEGLRRLDPTTAQEHGLAIVHQHPALLPDLTVAENIRIAVPEQLRHGNGDEAGWMNDQLARVGCSARLSDRIEDVSVAQRLLVELAKALALNPRILILDEPTAPLGAAMVDRVLSQVREAAARNVAVIYISHRLPEVRRIADRVTVMRDGEVRGSAPIDDMSDDEMLRLIVGRTLSLAFPKKRGDSDGAAPTLEVERLSGSNFRDVSLSVGAREIVGLAGVAGNGQAEFLRALAGLERSSGSVSLNGKPVRVGTSRSATEAGIVYLSADRHGEGLVMPLSVRENAALSALTDYSRFGIVSRRKETRDIDRQREEMDIRTASIATEITNLSGGNQQKVALARALLAHPAVVLADEPTQGVDAGARVEIYRKLREIADAGIPVIVCSSDALELEGLCDRIVVFSRGHVVEELTGSEVTEEGIARAIVTATAHREDESVQHRPASADGHVPFAQRLRDFARGDYAPSVVLVLVILVLGVYTYSENELVTTAFNVSSMLTLLAALAFIAFGQQVVILTGGIDLSVGPLTGLMVVIASFFVVAGKSIGIVVLGFVIMLAVAGLVGLVNGSLVRFARFTPIAATLATYIALQGISLLLRPEQEGLISRDVTEAIKAKIGSIPVAFLVAGALAIALEIALRRTKWGLGLRAVGSREESAHRLGVNTNRTVLAAYVLCSLLTFLGGVMLMAQIGVGDPTQGVAYTLSSITAVVLGGASLFGGRGSFIGALLGAFLIQQTINATTFLELTQSWQYFIVGLLTLVAAGIYTQARHAGKRA
jgi:ribose transport system ATP-binding protein